MLFSRLTSRALLGLTTYRGGRLFAFRFCFLWPGRGVLCGLWWTIAVPRRSILRISSLRINCLLPISQFLHLLPPALDAAHNERVIVNDRQRRIKEDDEAHANESENPSDGEDPERAEDGDTRAAVAYRRVAKCRTGRLDEDGECECEEDVALQD